MQNKKENEKFKALLKTKGLKVTVQRLAVLNILKERDDEHLTAEEIYDLVKKNHPEIGLATVYRTIQLLSDMGIIDKLSLDDGFTRYEMGKSLSSGHRHHHLICLSCNKIFSFEKDFMEPLENEIEKVTGFRVVNHEAKLFGYCKECNNNTKQD